MSGHWSGPAGTWLGWRLVTNTGPRRRPVRYRGSSRAAPDAQTTTSRWPPLPMTAARLAGQIEVLDVEGEDLVAAGCGFVQHPPQRLFPQADVGSGPEGVEVVVGDCFGLVPGDAFAVYGRQRVRVGEPPVAATVADEGLEGREASVPGGRRCFSPAFGEYRTDPRSGELAQQQVWTEIADESVECLAVGTAGVGRQVLVGEERFHRITEGGDLLWEGNDFSRDHSLVTYVESPYGRYSAWLAGSPVRETSWSPGGSC